ncbi:MAG: hypothetical protein IJI23_06965, partial [Lachnospiraceae bacterium]|nr:hypothetical protein [Lachnospiraceae bacterium]
MYENNRWCKVFYENFAARRPRLHEVDFEWRGSQESKGKKMIDIFSVDNMRKSDAATIAAGTPGTELMMRAARGVFGAVPWKAPVAIVCGSGNNAGDG